jgi:hypothetical protein
MWKLEIITIFRDGSISHEEVELATHNMEEKDAIVDADTQLRYKRAAVDSRGATVQAVRLLYVSRHTFN